MSLPRQTAVLRVQLLVQNDANRTSLRSHPYSSLLEASWTQNALIERLLRRGSLRSVDRILSGVVTVHTCFLALIDHGPSVAHRWKEAGHSPNGHEIGRHFPRGAAKGLRRGKGIVRERAFDLLRVKIPL